MIPPRRLRRWPWWYACHVALCLTANPLHAEEAAFSLPEVSVDTQAYPEVAQQLGQTTELNREALDAGNRSDLNGALRALPGLNISQSNASTTTGLTLRGASGGLGLVTLDGVPLFNSFNGYFPLSHYPLDLFDRVEVSRGSGQLSAGSRTLGGSINLSSRDMEHQQAFIHTEGGSYGTLRTNLGGGLHNDWGHWTVAAGRGDIFEGLNQASPRNGATERDNFQMTNGLLHWNRDFRRGSMDSSVYFVRSREGMDGPGLLPTGLPGWMDDPNGLLIQETWVAQNHASYQLNDHWSTALRMGYTQDRQSGEVGTIPRVRFPMNLTSQLWLGHWENNHDWTLGHDTQQELRLVWGVDAQQQHGENQMIAPSMDNMITNTVISPLARIELEWQDWLASTDMRVDHNDQYGDHTVFSARSGWRLTPGMLLWAKGGTGYRAPAVNERLHPMFGDPNILPETSVGGEIGWRWQANPKDELSVTSYFQHYRNLIVLQRNAITAVTKAGNISQADVWSVELQASHQWNDAWRSGLSYTFMDARNPQNGHQIPWRPEHQGQFWSEWRILQPISLRVDLTFRDGYWVDGDNTLSINPAPHLNININYQVNPKLRVYLRGENINDDRTADLYEFNYVGAAVYGGAHIDW